MGEGDGESRGEGGGAGEIGAEETGGDDDMEPDLDTAPLPGKDNMEDDTTSRILAL